MPLRCAGIDSGLMAGEDEGQLMQISPEEYIFLVFRDQFRYHIEKIPETDQPRPDFYLEKGGDEYLVEVKSKEPNAELRQRRDDLLTSGQVFDDTYTLVRQPSITKTVSEAKKQLISLSQNLSYFRLVCIVGVGHNAEARLAQAEATLFGRTTVGDWSTENRPMKDCYYFGFSDFYRYRTDLDGAILVDDNNESGKLCLNNHSPRYDALRQSSMAQTLGTAVIDPPELERSGDVWIVDSDVDRSNKTVVIDYLRDKYSLGHLVMDMDMKHASAQVLLTTNPKFRPQRR